LRRRLDRNKKGELVDQRRDRLSRDIDGHIETGFHIAAFQGPLCAEPMANMAFFVERVEIDKEGIESEQGKIIFKYDSYIGDTDDHLEQSRMSQITGSLISAAKEAFRSGLLDWSPRLMLAMYSCDIQASSKSFVHVPPPSLIT